ncbi:hypothetical protein [Geothermobacter ehrlichii]|uniref:hypothetical protein n=1 Tax=Geothermobacter ehrlichii TaxID=213224 RepID=UPI0011E66B50|nr:hypothetical protein [Geothermobacter ehrlichii]
MATLVGRLAARPWEVQAAKLVGDILKVDSSCCLAASQCDARPVLVAVDSEKFRRFGIWRVSAITLDRGEKEPLTVHGDMSLAYAMKQFAGAEEKAR